MADRATPSISPNNYVPGMIGAGRISPAPCFRRAQQHRRGRRTDVRRARHTAACSRSASTPNNSQLIFGATTIRPPGRSSPAILSVARGGGECPLRRRGRGVARRADNQLSERARRHEQHRWRRYLFPGVGWHGHGRRRQVSFSNRAGRLVGNDAKHVRGQLVIDGSTGVTVGGQYRRWRLLRRPRTSFRVGTNICGGPDG